jgi:UDP-N-acetylmuramate--alanine ligase
MTPTGQENRMQSIFFIGIGGSGMNGIARIMNHRGHRVSGSDRDRDLGNRPEFYQEMVLEGIQLYPQDGSGIHRDLDQVVTSTAVESTIPDVKTAVDLGIPIIHRADALSELVRPCSSISVAGTSGKSTVTGMCAWGMKKTGFDPTVVNGAKIIGIGNHGEPCDHLFGDSSWALFEADESDGSLKKYRPLTGILTNISKDHLPLRELSEIFHTYIRNIKDTLIFNTRCKLSTELALSSRKRIGFGYMHDADFQISNPVIQGLSSECSVEGRRFRVNQPGLHNLENALAAYSLLRYLGKTPGESIDALEDFRGIHRRFEIIGEYEGITIVDDFAHNPDKIRSTMDVARQQSERVIYIYQPHGFGPTRFLFDDLVQQFINGLRETDKLILAPIFYAGGTAGGTVSSDELAARILSAGKDVDVVDRAGIPGAVSITVHRQDWVVVMGARDPSLPGLCQSILRTVIKNFSG